MLEDLLQRRPYNAVTDFIDANVARGLGSKIAFTDSDTHAQLRRARRRARFRFASALGKLGVCQEQRVMLLFHDTVDYPVAFWGAIRAGVVPVPVNTLLTAEQYAYLLADSRATAAVVAPALAGLLSSIRDRLPHLRTIMVAGAGRRRASRPARPAPFRGRARRRRPRAVHRVDHVGRGGVLALHLRLHRRSQGGQARSYQPDGDRAAHGPGRHRHPRRRRGVLGGQAVVRLRARQLHVVPDVGRRERRIAAGAPDAAGGAR